jgi:hypothetical protein
MRYAGMRTSTTRCAIRLLGRARAAGAPRVGLSSTRHVQHFAATPARSVTASSDGMAGKPGSSSPRSIRTSLRAGQSAARRVAVVPVHPVQAAGPRDRSLRAGDVPLTIAGSGPEERNLRQRAAAVAGDVRFEVSPSDDRLRELYRSSEVLIFPRTRISGSSPSRPRHVAYRWSPWMSGRARHRARRDDGAARRRRSRRLRSSG